MSFRTSTHRTHEHYLAQVIRTGFGMVRKAAGKDGKLSLADQEKLEKSLAPKAPPADEIAHYLRRKATENGKQAVSMKGIWKSADEFTAEVVAYDRFEHAFVAGGKHGQEPEVSIEAKRARNHAEAVADKLEADQYGPAKLPQGGADALSATAREEILETALTDLNGYDHEVLCTRFEFRDLPKPAKVFITAENRGMAGDKEANFGAKIDTFYAVYRAKTDHTIVGYLLRAAASAEGVSYSRDIGVDLKGAVLFDSCDVG